MFWPELGLVQGWRARQRIFLGSKVMEEEPETGARGVGGREDSLALGQHSQAGPLVLPLVTSRVPTAK